MVSLHDARVALQAQTSLQGCLTLKEFHVAVYRAVNSRAGFPYYINTLEPEPNATKAEWRALVLQVLTSDGAHDGTAVRRALMEELFALSHAGDEKATAFCLWLLCIVRTTYFETETLLILDPDVTAQLKALLDRFARSRTIADVILEALPCLPVAVAMCRGLNVVYWGVKRCCNVLKAAVEHEGIAITELVHSGAVTALATLALYVLNRVDGSLNEVLSRACKALDTLASRWPAVAAVAADAGCWKLVRVAEYRPELPEDGTFYALRMLAHMAEATSTCAIEAAAAFSDSLATDILSIIRRGLFSTNAGMMHAGCRVLSCIAAVCNVTHAAAFLAQSLLTFNVADATTALIAKTLRLVLLRSAAGVVKDAAEFHVNAVRDIIAALTVCAAFAADEAGADAAGAVHETAHECCWSLALLAKHAPHAVVASGGIEAVSAILQTLAVASEQVCTSACMVLANLCQTRSTIASIETCGGLHALHYIFNLRGFSGSYIAHLGTVCACFAKARIQAP